MISAGSTPTRRRSAPGVLAGVALGSIVGPAIVRRLDRAARLPTQVRRGSARNAAVGMDPLTGMANRATFDAALRTALHTHPARTAVLFLDLDDFKRVNDTLGHAIGDELIIAVADRLTSALRTGDTIARLGGDEFAVLINDVAACDAASPAGRFIAALAVPFSLQDRTIVVRTSGGLAVSEGVVADCVDQRAADLLRRADLAMYANKRSSGTKLTLFHPEMQSEMLDRLALEADLRDAIADGDLHLVYQPIVDARYGTVRVAEALLRWSHADRGPIGPDVFIPVAEQTGVIVPMTLWIVRQVARQLRSWDLNAVTKDLAVALNLSPRVVVEPGIGMAIARELNQAGIDPRRMVLEVTESLLVQEPSIALQTLRQLRAFGMRLSVDDFGTGVSSLSQLASLPIDEVKIDGSLIHQIHKEPGRSIVAASIAMAHGLGLRVVAEGVEDDDQMLMLRSLRCDDIQGYCYSPPIDPLALIDLLSTEGDCIDVERGIYGSL